MTPPHPLDPRPRDFSGRITRRARARPAGLSEARRHFGRRLAVLIAAIAVPAMAAPVQWPASAAPALEVRPMPFETAGASFPGSAYYYLAEQPYVPAPSHPPTPATEGYALATAPGGPLGPEPLARSLLSTGSFTDHARALRCMTMAIYYEAATEPDAGQRAVAQVILNRVSHPSYPDTVCGVVFQGSERATGCQFSFTCDGALARAPMPMWWERAEKVARAALAGAVYAPVGFATHYHTVQVHPYWADSLQPVGVIGAHIFYRWRGLAGQPAAFADRYFGGEPLAAPHMRTASAPAVSADADPVALARAYEAGVRAAAAPAAITPAALVTTSPAIQSAPRYAAPIEARGGDALFRVRAAPGAGEVRAEFASSGQWLKQP